MKNVKKLSALALAIATSSLLVGPAFADDLSANVSVTNNYIWRGLTQTTNEPAVQGGIDYSHDSGFYAGTWASNVQYGADDVYSYEHDLYFGFAGESGDISYDVGYLYYNYDAEAEFDFAEIYGTVGYGAFSATLYLLAHTEADEAEGQDFGFGKASYISLDYATEIMSGTELGLHVGHHQGDFAEAFNGLTESYNDWAVSLSKDGFSFAITGTDMDSDEPAAMGGYDNDEIKFVVSYGIDIQL
ncbi:TorF family putative porin [Salinimonas lutimaris]|uniref:TorF family putative porin n=1 Tax=Salinimonas lutimaris TaxID=914153 RepID=UPI0010C0BF48|nr:TorF family putative porin [Salinimonas lutimaris]|tara:strand:+ start:861 stop:1592 length:732 start_codon:yes stop_codon:yes gene_type:complete